MPPLRLACWLAATLVLLAQLAALAQGGRMGFPFGSRRSDQAANVPYDGRFTFVRIRYAAYRGWRADYPTMERNLTSILKELTSLEPHLTASNVHTFDDPELFRYPIAYLSEPGYWYPNDAEVRGLQQYLAKGGFLIVDDFHFEDEWAVFEAAMRRVLPDARIERLNLSHPVFNTFFQIKSLEVPYPGRLGEQGLMGEFYGIHDQNDPTRRLLAIINYNIDVGDYVEWSHTQTYALAPTNEAYKFAVNYIIYGMTH